MLSLLTNQLIILLTHQEMKGKQKGVIDLLIKIGDIESRKKLGAET